MAGSSPMTQQRRQLDVFLKNADERFRRILEETERELERAQLLQCIPQARNLTVAKLEFQRSTYVVTRVPRGERRDLSQRQREIAALVLEGLPRKSIARELGISPRTVDTHLERLYVKCHVDSRIALVRRLACLYES